jgi:hypothetical protein
MSNRTTTAPGAIPILSRTSQVLRNIVPANSSLQFPVSGNTFYVLFTSAQVIIKPGNGSANPYDTGTGLAAPEINSFGQLQIINPTANAIVFEIFVGFDGFIDNRVILAQVSGLRLVAYPTYPVTSAAASVAINDISATAFNDINGNQWYAVNRVAIIISNPDTGVTLFLQEEGSSIANGPAIAAIYPLTSLNYPVSGNYSLSVGGGNINALVSEIYNAIPAF